MKEQEIPKNGEKNEIRLALSWFGAHVVAVILCLIVTFSFVTLTENNALRALIGIIAFAMYFMLLGGGAWKLGNDDLNKVKFGRRERDLWRGARIGLIASAPMILFAIALILAKAQLLPDFYIIYKILSGHLLVFINFIDGTFRGVADTAYLTQVSWGSIIGVSALSLITPIICGAHYILGYKDVVMMEKLVYKKSKSK